MLNQCGSQGSEDLNKVAVGKERQDTVKRPILLPHCVCCLTLFGILTPPHPPTTIAIRNEKASDYFKLGISCKKKK